MTDTLCEHPSCPRAAAAGSMLCAECRHAVRRELLALPNLYRDCEARLASSPQGIIQRISRTKEHGISLNDNAVSARGDIVDVLSLWCALVAGERAVPGPATRTAGELAAFLDRHLGWLAAHPAAGDFVTEVGELADAARAVADPDARRTRHIGPCDRPGCGQPVYLTIAGGARRQLVRCAAGHAWQPHEWLSLSLRMRQSAAVTECVA